MSVHFGRGREEVVQDRGEGLLDLMMALAIVMMMLNYIFKNSGKYLFAHVT